MSWFFIAKLSFLDKQKATQLASIEKGEVHSAANKKRTLAPRKHSTDTLCDSRENSIPTTNHIRPLKVVFLGFGDFSPDPHPIGPLLGQDGTT
jgi:hypothetical protein